MIEGRILRRFDPWRGALCTCPAKYSISPYTGCGHSCLYCYITSYIKDPFKPRPKRNFLKNLMRDLRRIKPSFPVSMSNSSDPYTPPEEDLKLTREVLRLLVRSGFKVLVITKSDLVVRDVDLISEGSVAVSMTITTMSDEIARKLEPGAPPPIRRMRALKKLSSHGIPTILRLDPIIPGLNDSKKSISEVLEGAKRAGVLHVVTSTYKARADSLRRLISAFPRLRYLRELYKDRFEGSWYLPYGLRRELLLRVKELAERLGMTHSTCREGMSELNSKGVHCDGSHFIIC